MLVPKWNQIIREIDMLQEELLGRIVDLERKNEEHGDAFTQWCISEIDTIHTQTTKLVNDLFAYLRDNAMDDLTPDISDLTPTIEQVLP